MNNFVLQLHGPICSGKTTVIKELHSKLPRTFLISSDRLKWLISDYKPSEDRETVALMVLDLIKRALSSGWNVIQDSSLLWIKDETKNLFEDYYIKNNIKLFHYNLEAPLPILLERLDKRIESEKMGNIKVLIKNHDAYLKSYNRYQVIKKDYPTFNTTEKNAEAISSEIFSEIINNYA